MTSDQEKASRWGVGDWEQSLVDIICFGTSQGCPYTPPGEEARKRPLFATYYWVYRAMRYEASRRAALSIRT